MGGDGLRPGRFFQAGGESKSEFFRDPSGMVGQHFPSFSASGFTKPRRSAQNDAKNSHFVWENAEISFSQFWRPILAPKLPKMGIWAQKHLTLTVNPHQDHHLSAAPFFHHTP